MRVMQLNGTSAIVTGGASGLGAGTVRALAGLGVRCVVFDKNESGAKEVASEIGGVGIGGDVTDPEDCQRGSRRGRIGWNSAHSRQLRRDRLDRPGSQQRRDPSRPEDLRADPPHQHDRDLQRDVTGRSGDIHDGTG